MDVLQQVLDFISQKWNQYGGSIIYSIIIVIIGYILIRQINKAIKKTLEKVNKQDSIIMETLTKCIKYAIWLIIVLLILAKFNILETAVLAIISFATLTFSLALKDTLSNIAKGIQILITKPYAVGDSVEIKGVTGTVKKIQIIYTQINTDDNKSIMIPNNIITEEKITNYSKESIRRLDLEFPIDYDIDIQLIQKLVSDVISSHPLVLHDPSPCIRAGKNIPGKVILIVKMWTRSENYAELNYDMIEQIKSKLNENNIELSSPHMNINITNKKELS